MLINEPPCVPPRPRPGRRPPGRRAGPSSRWSDVAGSSDSSPISSPGPSSSQRLRRGRGPMTAPRIDPPPSPKLRPWHLDRSAIAYARQSPPQQVPDHQESTARQYALVDRAIALGWPRSQVQVIDDDLGKSGQSVEGRPGFQRLLAEVALDRVGLILGLEMSRLARSCKDWHHLLELCGRFRVLLADADGAYDRRRAPH